MPEVKKIVGMKQSVNHLIVSQRQKSKKMTSTTVFGQFSALSGYLS
jgi:hypothetical protein